MTVGSNLQRERQQRGDDFQEEIRRSWRLLPNCWRMRIADGQGGTRPADEIILLENINVIAELKRTQGTVFKLNMLRPNQIQGLVDFDEVIDRNYGLVFISFLDENNGLDEAYIIRLTTALRYMKKTNRLSIPLQDMQNKLVSCIEIPLMTKPERTYNLRGLIECYKLL